MTTHIPIPSPNVMVVTVEGGGAIVIPIRLTDDQRTILAAPPEVFREAEDFRQKVSTRMQAHVSHDPRVLRFVGRSMTNMHLVRALSGSGATIPFKVEPENIVIIEELVITDIETGIPPIARN